MSATISAAPAVNADAAFNTLYDQVMVPVFFDKCAQGGLRPANLTDAQTLLRIGQKLLAAEQVEQTKQAAASGSFLDSAAAHLDQVLGMEPLVTSARDEQQFRDATMKFAAQEHILRAAAALNQVNAAG